MIIDICLIALGAFLFFVGRHGFYKTLHYLNERKKRSYEGVLTNIANLEAEVLGLTSDVINATSEKINAKFMALNAKQVKLDQQAKAKIKTAKVWPKIQERLIKEIKRASDDGSIRVNTRYCLALSDLNDLMVEQLIIDKIKIWANENGFHFKKGYYSDEYIISW